jgi:hypothetical protein
VEYFEVFDVIISSGCWYWDGTGTGQHVKLQQQRAPLSAQQHLKAVRFQNQPGTEEICKFKNTHESISPRVAGYKEHLYR